MSALRRALSDQRGVAYVEFLVAFPPVFILCLGIAQYAMLWTADLVVAHAARTGARAAIVVLDDDPAFYGEDVGMLNVDDDRDVAGWERALLEHLGVKEGDGEPWPRRRGGARLSVIRRAVSRPLSVLAPSPDALAARLAGTLGSLAERFEGGSRIAVGLGFYNDWTAAVTFPRSPGDAELHGDVIPDDAAEVTLRVTYAYRCGVPIVAAVMCRRLDSKGLGASKATDGRAELSRVPSPLGLATLLESGGHYRVLRAEATLPRQRAGYAYSPDEG